MQDFNHQQYVCNTALLGASSGEALRSLLIDWAQVLRVRKSARLLPAEAAESSKGVTAGIANNSRHDKHRNFENSKFNT